MKRIHFRFPDGSEALVALQDARGVARLFSEVETDPAKFLGLLADELQALFDRSIWRRAPGALDKPCAFHAYELPYSAALEASLTILTQLDGTSASARVAFLRSRLHSTCRLSLRTIRLTLLKAELATVKSNIAADLAKAKTEAA